MVALEEKSLQVHGMVLVAFGMFGNKFIHYYGKKPYLAIGLPYKVVSLHLCMLNDSLSPVVRYLLKYYEKHFRFRTLPHVEGKEEMKQKKKATNASEKKNISVVLTSIHL